MHVFFNGTKGLFRALTLLLSTRMGFDRFEKWMLHHGSWDYLCWSVTGVTSIHPYLPFIHQGHKGKLEKFPVGFGWEAWCTLGRSPMYHIHTYRNIWRKPMKAWEEHANSASVQLWGSNPEQCQPLHHCAAHWGNIYGKKSWWQNTFAVFAF